MVIPFVLFFTAADCGPSFQPFTLVESQSVRFAPTKKYLAMTKLTTRDSNSVFNQWRRRREVATSGSDHGMALSISFRTLQTDARYGG